TRYGPSDGLPTNHVTAVIPGGPGQLWIGTSGGLARMRDGRIDRPGPFESSVASLYLDTVGAVWIGADDGTIARWRGDRLETVADVEHGRRQRVDLVSFERSDERRDVAATRVHQPGAWKGHDGRLWFATDQGVVTVDPRRLRVNAVPPTVLVQEAIMDGRPLRRGEPNMLPPGPGNLEVHFAAVTLLEPEKA